MTNVNTAIRDKEKYYAELTKAVVGDVELITDIEQQMSEIEQDIRLDDGNDPEWTRELQLFQKFLEIVRSGLLVTEPMTRAMMIMYQEYLPSWLEQEIKSNLSSNKSTSSKEPCNVNRSELFNLICLFNQTNQEKLIQAIQCESKNVTDDLIEAFKSGDETLFLSIITKNNCDYSLLAKYLEIVKTFRVVSQCDDMAKVQDDKWTPEKPIEVVTNLYHYMTSIGVPTEDLKKIWGLQKLLEKEKSLMAFDEELQQFEDFVKDLGESYKQEFISKVVMYREAEFFPKEEEILATIFNRPEYKQLYEKNKAEIKALWEKKQQEKGGKFEETWANGEYNTDYKKFDACLKKGIDPETDSSEYYGGNLKFLTNGVLSSVIENFRLKGYLKSKDFSLFVYRMTGCGKPNYIIGNNKIAWCKDLTGDRMKEGYKELLSLCLILSSTIDYQKISKFFDLEDENYFHKKNLSQEALNNFYLAVTGKKNTSYYIK